MILGVDPGAHGALAVMTDEGHLIAAFDMPSIEVKVGKTKRTRIATADLVAQLRTYSIDQAYVERVGAMPGQGSASMFSFGQAAGLIEGVLVALGIPVTFITPVSWKRAMQVPSDKGACRQRAMQLFPQSSDLFKRVKDDGRAEAAILALYGLRHSGKIAA